jgi:predicted ATP-grasp superfamily ATP-dependent carboligase
MRVSKYEEAVKYKNNLEVIKQAFKEIKNDNSIIQKFTAEMEWASMHREGKIYFNFPFKLQKIISYASGSSIQYMLSKAISNILADLPLNKMIIEACEKILKEKVEEAKKEMESLNL